MLISITSIVIISQQHFLYNPAIFIPMNTKSIPAPTRQPPQISILISQYIISATTGLDIPLLICATFFPISTTQPALVCTKVAIVSKNTIQSEMNTFDRIIWKRVVDTEYHISRNTNKCKDHMEIGRVNDFCPAFIHPDLLIYRLTVRAVTVPTGIVVEFKVPAVRTLGGVDPQCPGLAGKDGPGPFLYRQGIPVPEDELPGGLRELGVSGRTDEDSSVGMFNIMAF